MKFELKYTYHAKKDLDAIDSQIARRIIIKLDYYINTNNPLSFAKRLTGDFKGLYRFRVGDYRAIFQKDNKGRVTILMILKIKHRKDIYE